MSPGGGSVTEERLCHGLEASRWKVYSTAELPGGVCLPPPIMA